MPGGEPAAEPASERLRALIRDVPDFPGPGILFRDITPLLADADALQQAVAALADGVRRLAGDQSADHPVDTVAGIEARGFVLGAAVAAVLNVGFVPVRKPGKLPWRTTSVTYDLEYGQDGLELHVDAAAPGQRVVVVDDVLATGGTAAAAAQLVAGSGAELLGAVFLIELEALGGRSRLGELPVEVVLRY